MGSYLSFHTNDPAEVNAKFFHEAKKQGLVLDCGSRLVNSIATALDDIAYIQVDPDQKHLRSITNVVQWFEFSSLTAKGFGQVKLSGDALTDKEQFMVDFVVNNAYLFDIIDDQSGELFKIFWTLPKVSIAFTLNYDIEILNTYKYDNINHIILSALDDLDIRVKSKCCDNIYVEITCTPDDAPGIVKQIRLGEFSDRIDNYLKEHCR